jgi:hypothetical protein
MQLRQDQHGRQRVDAPEAAQPLDRLTIRVRLREVRQPRVELDQSRLQMILDWLARDQAGAIT